MSPRPRAGHPHSGAGRTAVIGGSQTAMVQSSKHVEDSECLASLSWRKSHTQKGKE